MRHFMFLDESGEACVLNADPYFNAFVLCGILFNEPDYLLFDIELKKLKLKYFETEDIVFHSYEMRNKKDKFKIFRDKELLNNFYKDLEPIFTKQNYTIIACIVDKIEYKKVYKEKNNAYEDALTFICERAISCVGKDAKEGSLHFCLEQRGERKDRNLKKTYTSFMKYGTEYISTSKNKVCHPKLFFRKKEQSISGLELADLCAYPIAQTKLFPNTKQKTFEIFKSKFYCSEKGKVAGYGLKYFP